MRGRTASLLFFAVFFGDHYEVVKAVQFVLGAVEIAEQCLSVRFDKPQDFAFSACGKQLRTAFRFLLRQSRVREIALYCRFIFPS